MTEDAGTGTWKAPYLSYETLNNFFEKKLGSNPLPPRIDTHFLDNYAGSVRPLLIASLKTIGMIGENNEVLEPLRIAVQSPEARKKVLEVWATDFYAEQLQLATTHATASMLWESFTRRGYTGSTMRKAVVFYLSLVVDLGLPNSAHFKAPKAIVVKGAPRVRNAGQVDERGAEELPAVGHGLQTAGGETRVIQLGAAGVVTINVDVRWLDLPDETFVTLRRLVRELTELSDPGASDAEDDDEGDGVS